MGFFSSLFRKDSKPNSGSIFPEQIQETPQEGLTATELGDGWLGIGFNRENNDIMTQGEAEFFASHNPMNKNQLIGEYTRNYNSTVINTALQTIHSSTLDKQKLLNAYNTIVTNQSLISALDEATRSNVFTQQTEVYRMVDLNFLERNFDINVNYSSENRITNAYNLLHEKSRENLEFLEPAFTSCSYKEFGSEHCRNRPIELIIHCEEGQTFFQTNNFQESEIILPRNITFHILGCPELKDTQYGGKKLVIHLYI